MMTAERQRQRRFTGRRMQQTIGRLLEALERELSEVDAAIDTNIRGSSAWREKEDLLASVPGVGPTIARAPIADMPEQGMLDRRKIAALAGLAPLTRQSAQWKGRSFIGGGRAPICAALPMGAVTASRHNPALKAFRDRLLAAGKPKMVALVAVPRKLQTILNAIVRHNHPWLDQCARRTTQSLRRSH